MLIDFPFLLSSIHSERCAYHLLLKQFVPFVPQKDCAILSLKKGVSFVPQKGWVVCPSKRLCHLSLKNACCLSLKKAVLFVPQKGWVTCPSKKLCQSVPPNDVSCVSQNVVFLVSFWVLYFSLLTIIDCPPNRRGSIEKGRKCVYVWMYVCMCSSISQKYWGPHQSYHG